MNKATENILRLSALFNKDNLKLEMANAVNALYELESDLTEIRIKGEASLRRLVQVAASAGAESEIVARFLLNLHSGDRFSFNVTDFRRLDYDVYDDCLWVLKMDYKPLKEVHEYFENGGAIWTSLAERWNITDCVTETRR